MSLVKKCLASIILLGWLLPTSMILPTDEIATSQKYDDVIHRRDISVWTYDKEGTKLLIMSKVHQITKNEVGFLILHVELFDAIADTFILYMNGLYHDERGIKDFESKGDKGDVTVTSPYIPNIPISVHTWITVD